MNRFREFRFDKTSVSIVLFAVLAAVLTAAVLLGLLSLASSDPSSAAKPAILAAAPGSRLTATSLQHHKTRSQILRGRTAHRRHSISSSMLRSSSARQVAVPVGSASVLAAPASASDRPDLAGPNRLTKKQELAQRYERAAARLKAQQQDAAHRRRVQALNDTLSTCPDVSNGADCPPVQVANRVSPEDGATSSVTVPLPPPGNEPEDNDNTP